MIGPKMLQVQIQVTSPWHLPWRKTGPDQYRALGEDMAQAHPYLLERKGETVMGCPCVIQPPGMPVLLVGSWVRVEVIEP